LVLLFLIYLFSFTANELGKIGFITLILTVTSNKVVGLKYSNTSITRSMITLPGPKIFTSDSISKS